MATLRASPTRHRHTEQFSGIGLHCYHRLQESDHRGLNLKQGILIHFFEDKFVASLMPTHSSSSSRLWDIRLPICRIMSDN